MGDYSSSRFCSRPVSSPSVISIPEAPAITEHNRSQAGLSGYHISARLNVLGLGEQPECGVGGLITY